MTKSREWWIDLEMECEDGWSEGHAESKPLAEWHDPIHVIEYSTYEAAKAAHADALKMYNELYPLHLAAIRERDDIFEQYEIMRKDRDDIRAARDRDAHDFVKLMDKERARSAKAIEVLERMRSASECDFPEMPYWSDQVIKILKGEDSIEAPTAVNPSESECAGEREG